MKEKLAKLIDVKSIMTLLLTIVFCVMALAGVISGGDFLTIFTVIVAFYFGTQSAKKADAKASAADSYTGPQQGQAVEGGTECVADTVNAADAQNVHPPDAETSATAEFEY